MREFLDSDRPANIIGIDLGMTETLVARFSESGRPEITNNCDGFPVTPSVIRVDDSGNAIIGHDAKRYLGTGTPDIFSEFRRALGTDETWCVGRTTFSAAQLTAMLIKKVVADYERQYGIPTIVAITWPANFRNEQRVAMKDAVYRSGINDACFIEDPIAIALCFAAKDDLEGKYLIYDFGGATLDVSLLEIHGGSITTLSQDGVQQLGGKDLDNVLLRIIGEKFRSKTGAEFDAVDCNFDRLSVEHYKRALYTRDSVHLRLVSASRGPVGIEVTRAEFEAGISHLVEQAEMACENVLRCGKEDPGFHVRKSEIKEIFMVGATSEVPAMQKSVAKLFGKPPTLHHQRQACALGAAVFGALQSARPTLNSVQQAAVAKLNPKPCAPHFFGTSVMRDDGSGLYNDIVIRKGADLPCHVHRTYHTVRDGQTSVNCDMTQSANEENNPEFVSKLWDGTLRLPPGLPAGSAIKVVFTCDVVGCAGMQISLPEGGGPGAIFSTNQAPTPPPLRNEHRS
jgi:molecular chaperone DnaK (HSP70)